MNETILNATRAGKPVRTQGRSKMKFTFAPESEPLEGYTIVRPLAKGGFGEVYLAESAAGKEVALKLLRDNLEVELRGIRHCLNLKHPNLVPIYDIKEDSDGDHWIIMEYVNGPTLAEILDRHPRGLPLDQIRDWLAQISSGLDFLHDQGIVHRDLKPANIFEENGVLKIGDVGLSKYINTSHHTQTQSVGTVSYMAPEVSRGKYGRELDLYSLGVMLYEMLCGSLPFQGDTPGEVLMRHLTEHPDLSKVPERFRPLLNRALAKEPKQRFATAQRLLEEFDAALDGSSTAAEPIFGSDNPQEKLRAEVEQYRDEAVHDASGFRERVHQHARAGQRHHPHGHTGNWFQQNWKWLAIGGLLLMFFGTRLALSAAIPVIGIGVLAVLASVLVFIGVKFYEAFFGTSVADLQAERDRQRRRHARDMGTPASGSAETPQGQRPEFRQSSFRRSTPSVVINPDVPHRLPFPRRLAELMNSLGLATIFSAIVSAILMWWTDSISTPPEAATLTLCLTFASWGLLTETKFLEGRRVDPLFRRIRLALVGGIVGAGVYWINSWLLMPLDFQSAIIVDETLRGISRDRLLELHTSPLSDFMLYFALLFSLRRWWWHTDNFRPSRVRLSSLMGTFLLSILLPIFVSFPFSWSILIAVSLSAVVQLSAAWCPPEERNALLERQPSEGRG
ncbi:MAG: serine/threonine protein kinase [Planctomycetaceae bacterium]|nr:serine/threonine protein kinase [Planctomycetaceae bacterium]